MFSIRAFAHPAIFMHLHLLNHKGLMKKPALFLISLAVSLTACRKERICECSVTAGSYTVVNESVIKDTKRKARKACEQGSGTQGYASTTCVIKN